MTHDDNQTPRPLPFHRRQIKKPAHGKIRQTYLEIFDANRDCWVLVPAENIDSEGGDVDG